MSKELIRLRNIRMAFDDEVVLNDLNLYINDKEFLTLLGPSGCGKTTTLRIIGGFTTPVSGDVLFDGVRINDVPPYRRQINTVFQKYALFPHLTVKQNITLAPVNLKLQTPAEADEKAMRLLERIGLADKADAYPNKLSGGQKQRIAIARVFLKNPPILILDEATSALDSESEHMVQKALDNLMLNRTSLIIAHRLSTILEADRIVVMECGRIVDIGRHEELLGRCELYTRLYNMQFRAHENICGCETDLVES